MTTLTLMSLISRTCDLHVANIPDLGDVGEEHEVVAGGDDGEVRLVARELRRRHEVRHQQVQALQVRGLGGHDLKQRLKCNSREL